MQASDIPAKFTIPFGNDAAPGYIRTIPVSPTGTIGQASLSLGFPPENMMPVDAGGVPPFGQDMNGILKSTTAWTRWAATGAFPPYDPTWQAAVGGYPQGSCVASLVQVGCIWYSLVDNNVTNPDTGGAGWYRLIQIITANTDLYVNAATGSDSNDGLTPATALASIQAAVTRAFGFPPSQYTITIHVADGTYGAVSSPLYTGPNIIIDGNSSSPTSVLISSGSETAIGWKGPNTATVKNLKVQTGTGGSPANGISASSGTTVTVDNTVSGACEGSALVATGGTLNIKKHTFTGNCDSLLYATVGGQLAYSAGAVLIVGNNLTVTSTALVNQSGSIFVGLPQAPWTLTGSVTGKRYHAQLNGTIYTQGAGANYFPGTVAGTTSSGGQYA